MDTDSFIMHVRTGDLYKDIANDNENLQERIKKCSD